jgi:hypothetical protein
VRRFGGGRLRGTAAFLALALFLPAGAARAEEWPARDYSYLYLQGRAAAARTGEPLAGVTIEAAGGGTVHETRTDERGVFVFEKLPVGRYDIRILAPDGRVMQSVRDLGDGRRVRLQVRLGRGEPESFTVHPDGGRVAADLPPLPARWGRFWAEVGIILGVLLLFAL